MADKIHLATITIAALLTLGVAQAVTTSEPKLPASAPYLAASAPTFNLTLQQFQDGYNLSNPEYPFPDWEEVKSPQHKKHNLYFASHINETLYASIVIDSASSKVKTIQLTYLPGWNAHSPEIDENLIVAQQYMSSLLRWMDPDMPPDDSLNRLQSLLDAGAGLAFHQETDRSLRYVVADHGEKGITLALEPIKPLTSGQ